MDSKCPIQRSHRIFLRTTIWNRIKPFVKAGVVYPSITLNLNQMKFEKPIMGLAVVSLVVFASCSGHDDFSAITNSTCTSDIALDTSRGPCNEAVTFIPSYDETISGESRVIKSNGIPDHKVGLFGKVAGSLNPNAISEQSNTFTIALHPTEAASLTPLLSGNGPSFSFGVVLNGVELDPVAAEPFPHEGIMDPNVNWEWNLEATIVTIGLDCNNAHVQPNGSYHYHGPPMLYLENARIPTDTMTLIGYAADGFPIYYKYAYSDAMDDTSGVVEMQPSYRLKSGERPGDGITAPCGEYNGVYSKDYEYVEGLGTLDEANGRSGVTPEYPQGTYYYLITDDFPNIPRYFRGNPSDDFSNGI